MPKIHGEIDSRYMVMVAYRESYICLWHNGMLWVIFPFKSLGNPGESKGIAGFFFGLWFPKICHFMFWLHRKNHWKITGTAPPRRLPSAIYQVLVGVHGDETKPHNFCLEQTVLKKWCVLTESLEIGHLQASNIFLGWRWWLTYEIIHVYAKKINKI